MTDPNQPYQPFQQAQWPPAPQQQTSVPPAPISPPPSAPGQMDLGTPPPPQRHKPVILAGVGGLIILLAIAGALAFALNRGDDNAAGSTAGSGFDKARDYCAAQSGSAVADGGHTLTINGQGEEDTSGVQASVIACLLVQFHTPTAVVDKMDATRALDGRQEADWGKYHASWIFHPDDGLDLIVEWRD